MVDDAYKLSLGQTVVAVDYDHNTGKFTAPESIEPKPYMVLCGLHTLYKENLRSIMDLKIYIDTDEGLKRFWKIKRDVEQRGKSLDQVLASIEARTPDYQTHILPQKAYADIIFRYKPRIPEIYTDITLEVSIQNTFVQEYELTNKLMPFIQSISTVDTLTTYEFRSNITSSSLTQAFHSYGYNLAVLQDGYNGLIQLIILCIIWRT
jgi:hypothetical protein